MNIKYLTIAVMAGAALVGCTKTEPATVLGTSDTPIVFATPVSTKAEPTGPIEGAVYNTDATFNVWGVATENEYDSTSPTGRTIYMGHFVDDTGHPEGYGVKCEYKSTRPAWEPVVPYYWPKDRFLTFFAVSPSTINASLSNTDGIVIKDYETPATLANQYDIMYSEVSKNWKGSTFSGGDNTPENPAYTYKGVDLMFHHALSVVKFKVKTKSSYTGVTLDVKKIEINKVKSKGTFKQGISNPHTAGWELESATADYTVFSNEAGIVINDIAKNFGDSWLLLPQEMTDDAEIVVTYDQHNAGGAALIDQKATLKLNTAKDTGSNNINKWEMGKRYTYNIVFDMNMIYFDPATVDWFNVEGTINIIPAA